MVPLMVSPGTRTPPLNSIAAKAERAQVDSGRVLGACLFRARSGHLIGMGTGPRRASKQCGSGPCGHSLGKPAFFPFTPANESGLPVRGE